MIDTNGGLIYLTIFTIPFLLILIVVSIIGIRQNRTNTKEKVAAIILLTMAVILLIFNLVKLLNMSFR